MASKKAQIIQWLKGRNAGRVDEALAFRAAAEHAGVSGRTLRAAFLESGLMLDPMVEGVRQDSLANLERTLLALAAEYRAGGEARRRQVRAVVIEARRHAALASRRKPKAEQLLWLRTWLENPPLFAGWVELRRRACMDQEHAV